MSCGLSYQLMDEWTCVFCSRTVQFVHGWVWVLTHLGGQAQVLIDQGFGSAALVPTFASLHVASPKGFFAIIATALSSHSWHTQARSMRTRFYSIRWSQSVPHRSVSYTHLTLRRI